MTNDFTFIGEHRSDKDQLLVKGADGNYYAYEPERDRMERVDPDEKAWTMESPEPELETAPAPISPAELDLS